MPLWPLYSYIIRFLSLKRKKRTEKQKDFASVAGWKGENVKLFCMGLQVMFIFIIISIYLLIFFLCLSQLWKLWELPSQLPEVQGITLTILAFLQTVI